MKESEEEQSKRTKLQQEQDRLGYKAAVRLQEELNEEERQRMARKAEAKRNKPMTQAQQRNYMMNYIKHMGIHTLQQLKRYSFDELKELFETIMKNVNTFVPMETKYRGRASELAAGSSKKQKTNKASESVQEQPDEEEKELPQEDLQ
ncbi:hypothetical protein Tco_0290342 [Tanacetum coccineum]